VNINYTIYDDVNINAEHKENEMLHSL